VLLVFPSPPSFPSFSPPNPSAPGAVEGLVLLSTSPRLAGIVSGPVGKKKNLQALAFFFFACPPFSEDFFLLPQVTGPIKDSDGEKMVVKFFPCNRHFSFSPQIFLFDQRNMTFGGPLFGTPLLDDGLGAKGGGRDD